MILFGSTFSYRAKGTVSVETGLERIGSSRRSDDLEKMKNPLRPLCGEAISNVGNTIRSCQNLLCDEI